MKHSKNFQAAIFVFTILSTAALAPMTSQAGRHPPFPLPSPSHSPSPFPSPTPKITASGNWSDCNVVTDTRHVGSSSFLTISVTQAFTGTLVGSFSGAEHDFVHPDGSALFYGSGVFTGSVEGKTGTFKMSYVGTANSDDTFTAHWVVHDGTGQLTNIFGEGTFQGSASSPRAGCASPSAGTYQGQLLFASFNHH